MNLPFLFISGPEIMVIMLIVVMFFGADKIPEIARGLGKGMRQIKDATNEIKSEINESSKKPSVNSDVVKGPSEEFKRVKQDIDDVLGSVKRNL